MVDTNILFSALLFPSSKPATWAEIKDDEAADLVCGDCPIPDRQRAHGEQSKRQDQDKQEGEHTFKSFHFITSMRS